MSYASRMPTLYCRGSDNTHRGFATSGYHSRTYTTARTYTTEAVYSESSTERDVIGLDISSRVTVTATGNAGLGINEDFFVENIRQKITQGKTLHQVAIDLSPAKVTGGFWALGYGLLGKSTAFIY